MILSNLVLQDNIILISVEAVQCTTIRHSLQKPMDPPTLHPLLLYIRLVYRCQTLCSEEMCANSTEQHGYGVIVVPFLGEVLASNVVLFLPLFDMGDELFPLG